MALLLIFGDIKVSIWGIKIRRRKEDVFDNTMNEVMRQIVPLLRILLGILS